MMHTPATAALWFLVLTAPICFWVVWSDLKFMRIPNRSVLALAAVFLIAGPLLLPLADWGWRWTHLLVVLVVGFVLNAGGLVGGGDAKFAAAMAPFIARADVMSLMWLLSAAVLAALIVHRLCRAIPAISQRVFADWQSWTHKQFPMGLPLAFTLSLYLALAAFR